KVLYWCLVGNISLSLSAMLRKAFSVVSQSMQPSVTDTPYSNWLKSSGIDWLPALIWDSTINPTIDLFPSKIWLVIFSITKGCREGSLLELAWLQSTIMLVDTFAFSSACSAKAIETES